MTSRRRSRRDTSGTGRGRNHARGCRTEVRGELALDVTWPLATVGIGVAQLGEHRLRVLRDEVGRRLRRQRSERAVDNVMLHLRRKLPEPDVIETVRSVGFRLASA